MNTSRIFLQRFAPAMTKTPATMASRAAFSTNSVPAQKLRSVFEEYRVNNYSDELPSRFRKHIIKEIEEPDHGTCLVDNLNRILGNIGRQDAFLSTEEMNTLLHDAGLSENNRYIPVEKMMKLL